MQGEAGDVIGVVVSQKVTFGPNNQTFPKFQFCPISELFDLSVRHHLNLDFLVFFLTRN